MVLFLIETLILFYCRNQWLVNQQSQHFQLQIFKYIKWIYAITLIIIVVRFAFKYINSNYWLKNLNSLREHVFNWHIISLAMNYNWLQHKFVNHLELLDCMWFFIKHCMFKLKEYLVFNSPKLINLNVFIKEEL